MVKTLLLFSVLFLAISATAQDDKFLDFQSARIAFEKYNDCTEAEKLMKPIYIDFKEDMSFIHLYAKILKCLNKNKEALTVLQTFNAVAQDPTIDEEIAELNYKLKANNLTGQWEVISSNGDSYAVSTLTISHTENSISIKNSYYAEYGNATLFSEDDNYIKFRGTYTSKYTYTHKYQTVLQAAYGAGAYNTETLEADQYWSDIYYTYNKQEKTFSFEIPKVNIDNDGYVTKAYGEWYITAKRR